jgi:hypothetical protein
MKDICIVGIGEDPKLRMHILEVVLATGHRAIFLPDHIQPKREDVEKELIYKLKLFDQPKLETPFMPRKTAYERSHPNQPFYARFKRK